MAGHVHYNILYYLHYILRPAKAPPAPVSAGHGYNIILLYPHGPRHALCALGNNMLLQPLVVFGVQRPLERRTKRELTRGRRRREPKRILKKKNYVLSAREKYYTHAHREYNTRRYICIMWYYCTTLLYICIYV